MFLLAQKKGPVALNATQKKPRFYKVQFLKKSRKTTMTIASELLGKCSALKPLDPVASLNSPNIGQPFNTQV